ncbi:hypothetical protein [Paenibacillus sp. LHD-38]|uniref:hypothetical protein n=1 Tax=Paenibacillus sp. LHD-38 TaxID=3072143 RepID=UPI00281056AC|nr:hypothetical protein [Paenibacillus sp. LHD-38]MDQ8736364.1 hypothetical protein [Paenibacillus sp. LHD-38]
MMNGGAVDGIGQLTGECFGPDSSGRSSGLSVRNIHGMAVSFHVALTGNVNQTKQNSGSPGRTIHVPSAARNYKKVSRGFFIDWFELQC